VREEVGGGGGRWRERRRGRNPSELETKFPPNLLFSLFSSSTSSLFSFISHILSLSLSLWK